MYPSQDIEINTCMHVISFAFLHIFITITVFAVFFFFHSVTFCRERHFQIFDRNKKFRPPAVPTKLVSYFPMQACIWAFIKM